MQNIYGVLVKDSAFRNILLIEKLTTFVDIGVALFVDTKTKYTAKSYDRIGNISNKFKTELQALINDLISLKNSAEQSKLVVV